MFYETYQNKIIKVKFNENKPRRLKKIYRN